MIGAVLAGLAWGAPGEGPDRRGATDADGLYVELGRGIPLTDPGDPFELVLRGRLQVRATVAGNADAPPDLTAEVRRARLVLLGQAREVPLAVYIQLGVGPSDLEDDLPVPLRDGVLTWNPARDLNVRVGQMKVPFSRQRVVSSSALQFVDRSVVNAELNLDRDMGIQAYANDLFGWDGRLTWQIGAYGGDGRNRPNTGTGLLIVGRLQIQPLGAFDDVNNEADLVRSRRLRVSLGAAAARNQDSFRARSTHGALLDGRFTMHHGAVDLLAKWRGWALQSEAISRVVVDGEPGADDASPTSGWGVMAQLGHVLPSRWELAARYAHLGGLNGQGPALGDREEVQGAVGHYFARHDFKVQGDLGVTWTEAAVPTPTGRLQVQVFF